MRGIRTVIMRGGTSKALFLREADLPPDPAARDAVILALFGSPDPRQVDGLGGADPLTSKLAIIGPPRDLPEAAGSHLTYTFGQVEIDAPEVDYHSLCGNISAAVGAYAVYEGLVPVVEPRTRVVVYSANLRRRLVVDVPVQYHRPQEGGEYRIAGVPGTGARIDIDFADTAGAAVGRLLPTGNTTDRLDPADGLAIEASLLDIGNAHVFIRASDVGLRGTESAAEIDARPGLLERLETIRDAAALRLGMSTARGMARRETPATPILGIVSPPQDYVAAGSGQGVFAAETDLTARVIFMQRTHKTYAGTSTICTGVAGRIEGTLVSEVVRKERPDSNRIRVGHPAGVADTECIVEEVADHWEVRRATLGRTARRLMEGYAFIPEHISSIRP